MLLFLENCKVAHRNFRPAMAAWVAVACAARPADASTFGEALQDTKQYCTSPLRWGSEQRLYFAGAASAHLMVYAESGNDDHRSIRRVLA